MKWAILGIWVGSILFAHLRGRVRPPLAKMFLDHSVLLAPINAFMVLCSRVSRQAFIPLAQFPELDILQRNCGVFRDEALRLAECQRIKAAEKHDDIGFNSFFKFGWKRFYLKWYDAQHPSAAAMCPRSVEILRAIPSIKAAMFAELPPGGHLNAHRDPYAGSLRYHLGLVTPNDDDCFIMVDGQRYSWRDGEGVVFDETYVHEAHNQTQANRIILFCDVERPMRFRVASAINRYFGRWVMSAASSPNDTRDRTGAINQLTYLWVSAEQRRKRFKARNRRAYKLSKYGVLVLLCAGFFLI
jgi:beta-hydroxylase